MGRKRKWTREDLVTAVKKSKSIRSTIKRLGLIPAGGNYDQITSYIKKYNLSTKHFTGKSWNKGMKFPNAPKKSLKEILIKDSSFQSYKLKKRLFQEGLKKQKCEECSWATRSKDGRIPLELDHINGKKRDNRLVNLRVLCPNCHSLEPTHRGRNKKKH